MTESYREDREYWASTFEESTQWEDTTQDDAQDLAAEQAAAEQAAYEEQATAEQAQAWAEQQAQVYADSAQYYVEDAAQWADTNPVWAEQAAQEQATYEQQWAAAEQAEIAQSQTWAPDVPLEVAGLYAPTEDPYTPTNTYDPNVPINPGDEVFISEEEVSIRAQFSVHYNDSSEGSLEAEATQPLTAEAQHETDPVFPKGGVTEQIEAVRRETIAVLDNLAKKAGEFELAEPPPVLERYRRKMRENTYKVLVVGEAKRGKSTFVNALIGRDILPTDVGVATSQVFNIRSSQREACRLRFEDGSEQEISPEDLPLYGSQTMADAGIVPTSDQIIRWIEVDVPIRFLPEGMSIMDTPGLGALYAGHAQITHRFVPEADAVIFVLESGQPVIDEDLKFIEEILSVTRNIFFIQTKIDQYNREDWQDVQRRNQEILEEKFEGRLADTHVWPVSSTNLRKAASSGKKTEEAYLMVSRHSELAAALRAFLARVAGWSRAAEAMLVASQYHATSRKALSGRLAGFTEGSKQKRSELQRIAMEGKHRFDADWGLQGQKYQELREELQRAIAVGKQRFATMLQMGSDIELTQRAKIEAIKSLEEANQVGAEISGEVVAAAVKGWSQVCKEVQYRCIELLGPFAEAADDISAPLDPNLTGLTIPDGGFNKKFKQDYFMMLRGVTSGDTLFTGANAVAVMGGVAPVIGLALPPVWLVAIPALLVLARGIVNAHGSQLEAARGELHTHLMEVLQKVHRHFFDVDLAPGRVSRVDEYFGALERSVDEQVREMMEKKSGEADAEIVRFTEANKLDDRQRATQAKRAHEQLARWDGIGRSARDVMTRIKELERSRVSAMA